MNTKDNSWFHAARTWMFAAVAVGLTGVASAANWAVPKPSCSQGAYATYISVKFTQTGAPMYGVFKATSSDFDTATAVAVVKGNFTDSGVKPGVTYYYWLIPMDADGNVDNFDPKKRGSGYAKKPTVPKPNASDGKYTSYIKVTWKAVSGADYYKLYVSATKDFSDADLVGTSNGTTVTFTGTKPSKKYYFWIVPVVNGYDFKSTKSYDVGWRRKVLQIATPVYNVIGNTSYWILAQNGEPVVPKTLKTAYSVSKCATVRKYAEPDDDGLSGEIIGKKKGKVTLTASYNGLTVKAKAISIISSLSNVVSAYSD